MNLSYGIISIDDQRADNKALIREKFREFPETFVMSVDGKDEKALNAAIKKHPKIEKTSPRRLGEMGIWYSQLNAWQQLIESDYDGLIVLEDDAIPNDDCVDIIKTYLHYLPADWDMLTLWVPENQEGDFYINYAYGWDGVPHTMPTGEDTRGGAPCFKIDGSILAKAYQGYGGVAQIYSKKGAKKFYKMAELEGLFTTSDCLLFINIHRGIIKGYAPRPDAPKAFRYNWKVATNIHNTPFI